MNGWLLNIYTSFTLLFCFTDAPEFDPDDLHKFSKPVIVKVGQHASWKMPFLPQEGLEIKWFKDGAELHDGGGVKIHKDPALARLQIRDCVRSDEGEIKIKLKTPFGACEATSRLLVLGRKNMFNTRQELHVPLTSISSMYSKYHNRNVFLSCNLQISLGHQRVQWTSLTVLPI